MQDFRRAEAPPRVESVRGCSRFVGALPQLHVHPNIALNSTGPDRESQFWRLRAGVIGTLGLSVLRRVVAAAGGAELAAGLTFSTGC